MPVPAGSTRISYVGTAPGGEIWDTSLWWTGLPIDSPASANEYASSAGAAWALNSRNAIRSLFLSDTHLTQMRVYHYATAGNVAQYVGAYVFPTPVAGAGVAPHPLQVACCLTLQTALAGRSHRGRMYWPANAQALTSHQMLSADTSALSIAFAALIDDTKTTFTLGTPVVVSTALSAATPIVAVRVDSRLDIQRRRANRQAILYSTTTAL